MTFRPIQDSDRDFLFGLFASTREWEFQLTTWTEADKHDFLKSQFKAQDMSYRMNFLGAAFRIIQMDGVDIGRLYVDRPDTHMHIIDLTLAPEWCGRGIGSDILKALLNEAHGGKVPVRLSVEKQNPALNLYLRLGFRALSETATHYALEWRPQTGPREI
ncbi:GNAT family N-acetyltransferase [Tropicibacter oceani]|uniref:GNAT family N-acetyltransferase n=1 Tax=Tropicibacter oceani TaxID=3058420 RepID=A0ABY8QG45_9RHOB|nr:GNAT family N-acetyltransferase [Tropicibacter oceani]WGW02976.1 GNAT family N-acetyltransferase [Tropicibacter oceani]